MALFLLPRILKPLRLFPDAAQGPPDDIKAYEVLKRDVDDCNRTIIAHVSAIRDGNVRGVVEGFPSKLEARLGINADTLVRTATERVQKLTAATQKQLDDPSIQKFLDDARSDTVSVDQLKPCLSLLSGTNSTDLAAGSRFSICYFECADARRALEKLCVAVRGELPQQDDGDGAAALCSSAFAIFTASQTLVRPVQAQEQRLDLVKQCYNEALSPSERNALPQGLVGLLRVSWPALPSER